VERLDLLRELRIERDVVAPRRPSRLGVGILVGGTFATVLAAAGWWLLRDHATIAVRVSTIASLPEGETHPAPLLEAAGYVTARREATVSAQITGTLTDVLIVEGEHVGAGQILAHLEDAGQKAKFAEAQASYEEAQSRIAVYEAQLAQSRRDLARLDVLAERQLVSKQAVEVAQTQIEVQSAQLEAQRRQVEVERQVATNARVQLDFCTIRAPFAGVVIARSAQVGEIVSPLSAGGGFTRTGIGTIVDMDSLEVQVDVNESSIKQIAAGQPTVSLLDAYPDWRIPGRVLAVVPTADRSKATMKVRVSLDQKDARIVPDMSVRVSFLAEPDPAPRVPLLGVLVPTSSIAQRDGNSVVFVVNGDVVRSTVVKPVAGSGSASRVDGLSAGQRVVDSPPMNLSDGARVRIERDGA
jgi:RND family efflux transporter MFP subunit